MAEKPERIHWERKPNTWISPVGTVLKEGNVWTGHVYRNQRVGAAYTLSKTGFESAMSAAAWVENNAEN